MTTFPLTWPSYVDIMSHRARHIDNVSSTRSVFTGEVQKQRFQGERFEYDLTISPMGRREAMAFVAWLRKLSGPYGNFLFGDPDFIIAGPLGTPSGTPLVDGAGQPSASETLMTKGWTPLQPFVLRAGDFIQVGSGTPRLHINLDDVTPDSAGTATLNIWPRLRSASVNNDPITVTGAKGLFEIATPNVEYDSNAFMTHSFSLSIREYL